GRHLGEPGLLVIAVADAVGDGRVDGLRRAAPEPVVVVQVRVADRTGCTGAMALDAVHLEGSRARSRRELAQRVVGKDFLTWPLRYLRVLLQLDGFRCLHLLRYVAAASPAEHAGGGVGHERPGREGDRVANVLDDGDVEGPRPPARRRVVEFLDPVPAVAGG